MEAARPAQPETKPAASTAAANEAVSTGGDDSILIPAHVFCPWQKATAPVDFRELKKSLLAPEDKAADGAAMEYMTALANARAALVTNLTAEVGTVTENDVDSTLQKYVALLLGLLNRTPAGHGGASGVSHAETPSTSTVSGDSLLRSAVPFTWQDALVGRETVAAHDAVFELASVLAAGGLWKMQQAHQLCAAAGAQVPADAAGKAHKLLRSAAGLFAFAAAQCSNLLFNGVPSLDAHPQVLKAYELVCIADAQGITVLRAIQKGNAPKLVSSLAADTADTFRQVGTAAGRAPAPAAAGGGAPVAAYAAWKAAAYDAYALSFAGQDLMSEKGTAKTEAGNAIRCLDEAVARVTAATAAADTFHRAALGKDGGKKRQGPASEHAAFDAALSTCVKGAHAKIKRENDVIYYQRVPLELPERPPPRRLVTATPFVLPAPAALLSDGVLSFFGVVSVAPAAQIVAPLPAAAPDGKPVAQDAAPDIASEGNCCRWTLVVIAAPFLVLISVIGAVVWLLLLPVKIICCPIGCAAQVVWNAVEWGLKAPFRALLWASGKPWRPVPEADPEAPPHRTKGAQPA